MKEARTMNKHIKATLLSMASVLLVPSVNAQEAQEKRYYTPPDYAENVYFGDAHIHTRMSVDASLWGNNLTPADTYKYVRGGELKSFKGWTAKMVRPLDWTVISDHSDAYGFFQLMERGDPLVLSDPLGVHYVELLKSGNRRQVADEFIKDWGVGIIQKAWDVSSKELLEPGWKETVDAAEAANDPGNFTAFIAYEWSANPKGDNLHRVVIYRDDADKTSGVLPFTSSGSGGSEDPEDLWKALAAYEKKTGGQVLAIPHNGNWSSGLMFDNVTFTTKKPFNKSYIENRARWEPVYETTQIKGDGEAHPFLSPDDEFADYETWDIGNLSYNTRVTTDMLSRQYARAALKTGLNYQEKFGVNPFKFGLAGAGDSHTSLPGNEENNFFGKHSSSEPDAERWKTPFRASEVGVQEGWSEVASGLTGIWATENTRKGLFDALKRKEVYATTGTRLKVRVFGGWDFKTGDDKRSDYVALGYEKGVPMGGDLHGDPHAAAVREAFKAGKTAKSKTLGFLGYGKNVPGDPAAAGKAYHGIAAEVAKQHKSPIFLVAALMDPMGGALDRVQMVKGWRDSEGKLHEKVYDIAWSDNRIQDPVTGKLPPVGNTVNVPEATWTNSIGDTQLSTVWKDPDFDAEEQAFYYVRVLEIPTPRWTAYDAKRFGVTMGPEVPMTTEERVYTSPIWYTPAKIAKK
jgi:hypothetical protein